MNETPTTMALDLDELEQTLAEASNRGRWRAESHQPTDAWGNNAPPGIYASPNGHIADVFDWSNCLLVAAAVNALPALVAAARERDQLRELARAVVESASWQALGVVIECDCPRGEIGTLQAGMITHHTERCPVTVLAALLPEEAQSWSG